MKLLICDMDGTLFDSSKNITVSINHVRRTRHGLGPLGEAEVAHILNETAGHPGPVLYSAAYTPSDSEAFREHYRMQCLHEIDFYPGMRETLQRLHAAGVMLAVATNASVYFAERIITHLGVKNLFDPIVGADTVSAPKPDPAMICHIVADRGLCLGEEEIYMLGDGPKDMEAARRAGIKALHASWGYSPAVSADREIRTPEELLRL